MTYILMALVGWICGTGVPIRLPFVGGGVVVEPGDWPPNCPVCAPLIGASAGVLTGYLLGPAFPDAGMVGTIALAFFGGNFGVSLVGGIRRMALGRPGAQTVGTVGKGSAR